jgi:hypothetical protein
VVAGLESTVEAVRALSPFSGEAANACVDVAAPAVDVCCEEEPHAATEMANATAVAAADAWRR